MSDLFADRRDAGERADHPSGQRLVGFVSGLVGVGGGFIMTPSLIFLGVPAPVAVATGASQIASTSFSGIMSATRRFVDWRMGLLLSIGGVIGSRQWRLAVRAPAFHGPTRSHYSMLYVVFLAALGALMLNESLAFIRGQAGERPS